MRSIVPVGILALFVLGFAALAPPPAAADTTCGDIGCCHDFEKGKVFLRCVECVGVGNDWDIDTDSCVIY